ncbi:NAD-dependent epimerase/dehydratase family protein, partial [Candidatus Pacearchaeota archaeon]|nr:NAD-dependent epimerase/dehydratase family protein [Candidatus Pacearchaeota archaeon]MBD3283472.1 NAD-dependent epimerase/dehydratase family protein [Candidatus Pacearchaeota archaeon]
MARVFITGTTGFIGSHLLNEMINEDIKEFILLVRDEEKASEKLSAVIKKAKNKGKKIDFVIGDISKNNLGLSEQEIELARNCEEVYHLACNVSLSRKWKDKREIFRSNFKGTKNILEVFKNSDKLKQMYIFSSAYA